MAQTHRLYFITGQGGVKGWILDYQGDLETTHHSIRKMMVTTASFELENGKYHLFVKLV